MVHNYLDFLQIPLQPLRDNLPSQTYECFEEDTAKYDLYQEAMVLAFSNFKQFGALNLKNINVGSEVDNNNITKNYNDRQLTACVVGAGRGPLIRKLVAACKQCNIKNIKIYGVEKNINAFYTLLSLKLDDAEVFSNVEFVLSDMREWVPPNKAKLDIVISELLGSLGDNELSPECLLNVQK